jgi:mRNA interferase RelE/StbE
MKYSIDIAPKVYKNLAKLSKDNRKRIEIKIDALAENPRPQGYKQLKGNENIFRVRVGDYRIVYEIIDDVLIVYVLDIDHRRQVYR